MKYRIKDLCEINSENISKNDYLKYIHYLDTSNLTRGSINEIQKYIVGKDKIPSRAKRKVKINDILISTVRPNQRHYGIIRKGQENLIVSTGYTVLSPKVDKVNQDYLYWYLTQDSIINYLQSIAESSTSAYPSIKPSVISELEIDLPDLEEQETIANILSTLNEKLETNNQINEKLEEMAQALFKHWFIDFEFPNENGEPYKSSGGEMVDSELGMIPKGWQVGHLSDLIEIRYGKDHKKLRDGDIPVYGSGGVMRFVDTALYTSESVLVPRKGTLNNVMYTSHPFWSVDTMFYTEMKEQDIAKYIYCFLKTKDLASMNIGSAVPSMTTAILNKMPIVIQPLNVINRFNRIVNPFFAQIDLSLKENDKLGQVRDRLLPKLMSGEIRVPLDDEALEVKS
ncbi:restriction endonuclease subunit S [Pseudalkalibacillus caeni]|uniref:restriction endonuclease subunit S n=1 Tax=Exobacillus caeni TaxID=2574798 RepID=UPI001484E0BC|nr:restriction endonuclease subunit S [Pseudalkalibacillus caeni]